MYFKKCPLCGSNLDPGETCDCEKQKDEREKEILASMPETSIEEGGQMKWLGLVS